MIEETTSEPLIFEFVETSEESETASENATRYSDKTAIAQNPDQKNLPGEATHLSVNRDAIPQMMSQTMASNEKVNDMSEEMIQEEGWSQKEKSATRSARDFSIEALLGQETAVFEAGKRSPQNPGNTSVNRDGAFQLNTYAWDFAPYILAMKRRIEGNMYPPPAFNRLGIGGKHVLRFRILRDGTLASMDLLAKEGQAALVETSSKAIQVSAPYMPLPEDFPEPFLEITATFNYIILANQ